MNSTEKDREYTVDHSKPSNRLDEHWGPTVSHRNVTYSDAQTPTGPQALGLEAQSGSQSQVTSTNSPTYGASLDERDLDTQSDTSYSESSDGTSFVEPRWKNMMRIPDPPKEWANGWPFECPYCFETLTIKNTKHWR